MNANAPHTDLFKRFLKEMQLWCLTGKEPKSGSQDMKYHLDLQEKRLKSHNLKVKTSFEPDGEVFSSRQILSSAPIMNAIDGICQFRQSTYFQTGNQTTTYYRDDAEIYRKTKYLSLYETILDPEPGSHHIGAMPYTCPNCGAISQLSTLQEEGCPYCGTRYIMKDLYPKVTNYYALDNSGISPLQMKKYKAVLLIGALVISLMATIYQDITSGGLSPLMRILTFLGGSLPGAVLMYFCLTLFLMGKLLVGAGKSMKVTVGSSGTKKKNHKAAIPV